MHGRRSTTSQWEAETTVDERPPSRRETHPGGEPSRPRRATSSTDRIGTTAQRRAQATSRIPSRNCGTLVMLKGPDPGAIHAFGEQPLVLGRSVEATWRLSDADVSRRHARIYREEGLFFVEDLGSVNGTYVDGRQVTDRHRLEAGDRIQLGGTVLLRFDTHDAQERDVLAQLYRSAVRDPLTSAYNRRYLDERLRGEASYAIRHGEQLALVMLDVDHFKDVNDVYGHPTGDLVLRAIVSVTQRTLRPEDLLARYGGEELCVLARGLGPQDACLLADRLRRAIEGFCLRTNEAVLKVTVSAGVAVLRHGTPSEAAERLLSDADEALYRAKREGRNRVCVTAAS